MEWRKLCTEGLEDTLHRTFFIQRWDNRIRGTWTCFEQFFKTTQDETASSLNEQSGDIMAIAMDQQPWELVLWWVSSSTGSMMQHSQWLSWLSFILGKQENRSGSFLKPSHGCVYYVRFCSRNVRMNKTEKIPDPIEHSFSWGGQNLWNWHSQTGCIQIGKC